MYVQQYQQNRQTQEWPHEDQKQWQSFYHGGPDRGEALTTEDQIQWQSTYHWRPDTVTMHLPLKTRYNDNAGPDTVTKHLTLKTRYIDRALTMRIRYSGKPLTLRTRYCDKPSTIRDQIQWQTAYHWGPDTATNCLPLRTRYSGKPLTIEDQMVGAIFLHHWHRGFLLCGRLCILEAVSYTHLTLPTICSV